MAPEMGFHVIDATASIEQQQKTMREIMLAEIGESLKSGALKAPAGARNGQPGAIAVL
jgi:hypothetical protein